MGDKNTEKKYEEVEIVGKFEKKKDYENRRKSNIFNDGFMDISDNDEKTKKTQNDSETFNSQIKNVKKALFWKVFKAAIPHILIGASFIIFLFWVIIKIFAEPFNYIIAALLFFVLIKTIYKFSKFLK